MGLIEENKSVIKFFDGKTCTKLKPTIELKDIQKSIDLVEFNILKDKAEKNILKEEEEKKNKQATMIYRDDNGNKGLKLCTIKKKVKI